MEKCTLAIELYRCIPLLYDKNMLAFHVPAPTANSVYKLYTINL